MRDIVDLLAVKIVWLGLKLMSPRTKQKLVERVVARKAMLDADRN